MIEWGSLFLSADEITEIRAGNDGLEGKKGAVTVKTKTSGKYVSTYDSYDAAIKEARRLVAQVEHEKNGGELIQKLGELKAAVAAANLGIGLLDKRQRKLWRKLKEIIPEIGEEGAE